MSGFGQIPTSGNVSPKAAARKTSAEVVQITRLPDALQNNSRAVRLEGTVTQNNNNGTTRIQTERGPIDVKFINNNNSNNTRAPETGSKLEINIPAGRPPRQANVERSNEARSQNQQANTQTSTQSNAREASLSRAEARTQSQTQAQNQAQTSAPVNRADTAPRPNVTGQTAVTTASNNTSAAAPQNASYPPSALNAGANVRLVAVPPTQAIQIANASNAAQVVQQAVQSVSLPPTKLAPPSSAPLVTALTAAPVSAPSQLPLLGLGQAQGQIQAPALTLNSAAQAQPFTPNPLANNIAITPLQTNAAAASNGTLLVPASPNNAALQGLGQISTNALTTPTTPASQIGANNALIFQPTAIGQIAAPNALGNISANASLIPIAANSLNPSALSGQVAGKIDIQILQIQPANVALTAPNAGAKAGQPVIPALTNFTPPIIGATNASAITAQVTGFNAGGQPLVTLQLPGAPLPQSFILQYTPNNLSVGSRLQISVQNLGLIPSPATLNAQNPALAPLLQGFQWGALDEAVQLLIQSNPRMAASIIKSLPSPSNPAQLAAAGMAVMSAIKSGDLGNWLGERKIDALQRLSRGSNLMSSLTQDAPAAARAAESAADWRAVPLPMFWEGEIHKITLFTRKESNENAQNDQNNGSTRFIFDLSLSRMGDIQLDGYLKETKANKRLDLIIRAHNAFSQPMQQVMRSAYSNAIQSADMAGELNFQGSAKNWVHVLQENEQLGVDV